MANDIDFLAIMGPNEGPPLPRSLGIRWPWYKPAEVKEENPAPYVPVYAPAPVYEIRYPPAAAPQPISVQITTPPVSYGPPVYQAPIYQAPIYIKPEPEVKAEVQKVIPISVEAPKEVPKVTVTYSLSVAVSPAYSGRVEFPTGDFRPGTSISLKAIPYSGYEFDHWEGDVSGSSPSIRTFMDIDKTAIAYFRKVEIPTPSEVPAREYLDVKIRPPHRI